MRINPLQRELLAIASLLLVRHAPSMAIVRNATLLAMIVLAPLALPLSAEPTQAATAAFNRYAASVEARLGSQHASPSEFLVRVQPSAGQSRMEDLTPANSEIPGAMLHHWRGTAFVPGATAAQFDGLLRDLSAYPRIFAPEVTDARLLSSEGKEDSVIASLRLRQHHVITVVLDSTYAISYGRLDARHRFSLSRSTRIVEVASPNTSAEHALSPAEEHGFLWRLNTYWSWEERPEGLYLQVESISLTRSIPSGLGWAVRPFAQSIPRESLEFTLRAAANALRSESASISK